VDVPWALGAPADAVAYVFTGQLVAGHSPPLNGSNNKVLWVVNGTRIGSSLTVSRWASPNPL
jgi:hypothetical protein